MYHIVIASTTTVYRNAPQIVGFFAKNGAVYNGTVLATAAMTMPKTRPTKPYLK